MPLPPSAHRLGHAACRLWWAMRWARAAQKLLSPCAATPKGRSPVCTRWSAGRSAVKSSCRSRCSRRTSPVWMRRWSSQVALRLKLLRTGCRRRASGPVCTPYWRTRSRSCGSSCRTPGTPCGFSPVCVCAGGMSRAPEALAHGCSCAASLPEVSELPPLRGRPARRAPPHAPGAPAGPRPQALALSGLLGCGLVASSLVWERRHHLLNWVLSLWLLCPKPARS